MYKPSDLLKKSVRGVLRRAELIRRSLAPEVSKFALDKQFGIVTLTHVKLNRDKSQASVYFTLLNQQSESMTESLEQALNGNAVQFRTRLSAQLNLRAVPRFRFHYDQAAEQVKTVERLIRNVSTSDGASE